MPKLSKSKSGLARSVRRREEIRRTLPRPTFSLTAVLQQPVFVNTALVLISFLAISSLVVIWSRDQVKVNDGQVMTTTRLKRLSYTVIDDAETLARREEARKSAPRIYFRNDSYLKRLEAALLGLPKAVAGKISLDDISDELRKEFDLTSSDLHTLQAVVKADEPTPEWQRWISRLVSEQLVRNPLIEDKEYETYTTTLNKALMVPDSEPEPLLRTDPIELRNERSTQPDQPLKDVIRRAGFPDSLSEVVLKRLKWDLQPTINFSKEETDKAGERAANAIEPVRINHQAGEILYRRGDVLTPEQNSDVVTEAQQYRAHARPLDYWQQRLGVIGLVTIVTLFIGGFAAMAYPRITRNPLRIAAVCILMCSLLAVTALVTANAPIFMLPAAIGPTLIVAVILLIAYDQRLALLLSGIQCMLVTLALEQSIGFFILLLAGCATAIAQLREVRHRNSLIRAATGTGAVLAAGTFLLGLLEVPLSRADGSTNNDALKQIIVMSFSAALTSYGVSFLVLGILPSIERMFDIITGMTLAELRDPKRPLLRQLQQRAPGTYNHSLQVANIAEAAAEAIDADSLLVYVGALYHDIGKLNKPEYFVENQSGGYNRHDKLSPAMSLLVIIGHVKNGIELAREYGLPRQIIHFIESHHGTTLVEYFYHAAKAKSEVTDAGPSVSEIEYRYPGPKPRTKEAAIVMLADAVESAARAMADPNPSRIESLVRKLSARRLEDGQFDECDLTFRELALIEDAIVNRLMAIYHSRISYPTGTSGTAGVPGPGSQSFGRSSEQPDTSRAAPAIKPASA